MKSITINELKNFEIGTTFIVKLNGTTNEFKIERNGVREINDIIFFYWENFIDCKNWIKFDIFYEYKQYVKNDNIELTNDVKEDLNDICKHCGGVIEFYDHGPLYAYWDYYLCNKCGKRYEKGHYSDDEYEEC